MPKGLVQLSSYKCRLDVKYEVNTEVFETH